VKDYVEREVKIMHFLFRVETLATSRLLMAFTLDLYFFPVIDEEKSESQEDHDTRMKNIRWHLSEGKRLSNLLQNLLQH